MEQIIKYLLLIKRDVDVYRSTSDGVYVTYWVFGSLQLERLHKLETLIDVFPELIWTESFIIY
jgi:hypothetical protein